MRVRAWGACSSGWWERYLTMHEVGLGLIASLVMLYAGSASATGAAAGSAEDAAASFGSGWYPRESTQP